jgi:hypothetical protein
LLLWYPRRKKYCDWGHSFLWILKCRQNILWVKTESLFLKYVSTAKTRCSTNQRSMSTEILWVSLEERSRTNSPRQRFHSQLCCKTVRYFRWTLYKIPSNSVLIERIYFWIRNLLRAINHFRDQKIQEWVLLFTLCLHCAYSKSSSQLCNYEYRNWQPGESAAQGQSPASHGQEHNTLLMRQNSPVFFQGLRCEIPLGPLSAPAHKFLVHIRVTGCINQQRVYCSINLLGKSCICNMNIM